MTQNKINLLFTVLLMLLFNSVSFSQWQSELFPSDYQSINYAFDITPAKFINSFITEQGIYKNINDLIKQFNS